jgi:hypothetical protein
VNRPLIAAVSMLVAAAFAAPAAQERAPATRPTPSLTPLKLQVVLTRYNGDRKVSSMPYSFAVNATKGSREQPVQIRMGVELPIPQTTKEGTVFSYRPVGTNIDCWVMATDDGRFNVNLGVQDSSVQNDEAQRRNQATERATGIPPPPVIAAQPMFRSFNSNFSVLLKDGETTQYVSATDPVSGEVLKIDVTLNVVK